MSIMVQLEFPDGQTVLLTQDCTKARPCCSCQPGRVPPLTTRECTLRLPSDQHHRLPGLLRGAFVTVSWYLPLTRAIIWLDCPVWIVAQL